jgi:hypothetical protein
MKFASALPEAAAPKRPQRTLAALNAPLQNTKALNYSGIAGTKSRNPRTTVTTRIVATASPRDRQSSNRLQMKNFT